MKKMTVNNMLHNKRIMMVFSLLAAIVIWAVVAYGPSNETTKTINNVPIDITLTNGYAREEDIRVVGTKSFTTSVSVRGTKAVIDRLTADDINLRADTSAITRAGTYSDIRVTWDANLNYTITNVTTPTITLECDTWTSSSFPVKADISTVKTADEQNQRLGTPLIEAEYIQDGAVTIEGPSAVMAQIATVQARVQEEQTISEVQAFSATLVALNEQGEEVDLTECTVVGAENQTLTVTVPVLVYRRVNFTYQVENVPAYYENFLTISPTYIEFWGSAAAVESFASSVTNLGTFDFDNLSPDQTEQVIALNVPDGISIMNNVNEVTASFNFRGATTRTFNLTLETGEDGNVTFQNVPDGRTVSLAEGTRLTDITLCGPRSTLNAIRTSDLQVTIDMAGDTTTGPSQRAARITVRNRSNVWAYYGAAGENGMEIWVTVDVG